MIMERKLRVNSFSKQLKNIICEIDKYEGSKYKRSVTTVYLDNGSSVNLSFMRPIDK